MREERNIKVVRLEKGDIIESTISIHGTDHYNRPTVKCKKYTIKAEEFSLGLQGEEFNILIGDKKERKAKMVLFKTIKTCNNWSKEMGSHFTEREVRNKKYIISNSYTFSCEEDFREEEITLNINKINNKPIEENNIAFEFLLTDEVDNNFNIIDEDTKEKINFNNYYDKTKDNTLRDEYHTMEELYTHRTMLFAIICNQNKNISWKSKLHEDGSMFENMFIAGINTSEGQYTYHCDIKFWDLFNVEWVYKAPKWDGHKPEDIGRLFSIL